MELIDRICVELRVVELHDGRMQHRIEVFPRRRSNTTVLADNACK